MRVGTAAGSGPVSRTRLHPPAEKKPVADHGQSRGDHQGSQLFQFQHRRERIAVTSLPSSPADLPTGMMEVLALHRCCDSSASARFIPTGEVLRDVTWEVKPGDRIGLVGVNGAGKSTQLRLIAGQEEPTSGQVVRQGEPRIAYLQQEFDVDPQRSVREELFQAFGEAASVLNRQRAVEEAMGSEKAASDPDHLDG